MLEQILKISSIERRHIFAFILGFVYSLIGAVTAFFLFRDFMSLAMLFLTTLLLVPTLMAYLSREEKIERKEGIHHFFRNHRDVLETYFFIFLGVFLGYFLISMFAIAVHYDLGQYQLDYLKSRGVTPDGVTVVPESSIDHVLAIISRNLTVDMIAFLLSIAYGAGAIFLIVYNASIFSSFIALLIKYLATSTGHATLVFSSVLIHLIPEVSAFLLAAIAGGVISKALTREKFGTERFRNVIKDATILFIMSVLLIVIAAFLEIYVTRAAFRVI